MQSIYDVDIEIDKLLEIVTSKLKIIENAKISSKKSNVIYNNGSILSDGTEVNDVAPIDVNFKMNERASNLYSYPNLHSKMIVDNDFKPINDKNVASAQDVEESSFQTSKDLSLSKQFHPKRTSSQSILSPFASSPVLTLKSKDDSEKSETSLFCYSLPKDRQTNKEIQTHSTQFKSFHTSTQPIITFSRINSSINSSKSNESDFSHSSGSLPTTITKFHSPIDVLKQQTNTIILPQQQQQQPLVSPKSPNLTDEGFF
jgi:hypothetical protein